MLLNELEDKGILGTGDAKFPKPHWIVNNTIYLTISGSISYGCADTNTNEASDLDTIGICIPPKESLFPKYILGFDPAPKLEPGVSGVYEEHHINDPSAREGKGRQYDLNIYNITKFFSECLKCNPNLIDSLFTREECVLHCTKAAHVLKENRKIFLSKLCWNTYKEYAFSQLHKMESKKPLGKRKEQREKFGYDVKFGYNLVRILEECDQILSEGDLDLMRSRELLKSIRRGDWTQEQIIDFCDRKKETLEKTYSNSTLPAKPDATKVRQLLVNILEHHYGSLDKCLPKNPNAAEILLKEIKTMIQNQGF